MPTIEFSKKDLERLVGKKLNCKELEEAVLFAKGELEECSEKIKVDIKDTNRPDLWSVEGIARELRYYYGKEYGLKKYKLKKSGLKASVDPALKNIRPKAAYAVAKNIKVDEDTILQLIQLQEKICETFGRKRKEIAIGIFDLDKVKGNVKYYAAHPTEEFTPLGFKVKMSLGEILQEHPKGKEYGKLLQGMKKYPLLVDENHSVLSMPPIINSDESGKVTTQTKNLFIDITGFDQEKINTALEIVCMALADRGAEIGSVDVFYGKKKITVPEFKTKKISVPFELIERTIGEKVQPKKAIALARKKGFNAKTKGRMLEVEFPSWRTDILHPVDIIEDLIIALGYNAIEPVKVELAVQGSELKKTKELKTIREICIGMGLQGILTFTLTSREKQETKMNLPKQELVELENPVSTEWSVLRKRILPELLEFLEKNRHCAYPQKIFEVGPVVEPNAKTETKVKESNTVCIVLSGKNCDFNSIKAHLDALMKAKGWQYEIIHGLHPSFEKGRCALIKSAHRTGIVGEVSKKVLENFGLEMPVAAIEMEI